MKTCYSKILGHRLAVLDVSPMYNVDGIDPKGFVINRVNTPRDHRGQGHARELMRGCLADADSEGVTLFLTINAYGDMSEKQLSAWYERCGFVEQEGMYTRIPQNHERQFRCKT